MRVKELLKKHLEVLLGTESQELIGHTLIDLADDVQRELGAAWFTGKCSAMQEFLFYASKELYCMIEDVVFDQEINFDDVDISYFKEYCKSFLTFINNTDDDYIILKEENYRSALINVGDAIYNIINGCSITYKRLLIDLIESIASSIVDYSALMGFYLDFDEDDD